MLQSKKPSTKTHDIEAFDDGIAISPLAIPVLAGPGTLVTGMNFVAAANYFQVLITILIFALFTFLTYQTFSYSEYVVKLVGKKIFFIIGKLMGIILGVLGANILLEGIHLAFSK
ncbi:hypothetical protein BH23BAC2_BH23BAC2_09090 [soil metagenome]